MNKDVLGDCSQCTSLIAIFTGNPVQLLYSLFARAGSKEKNHIVKLNKLLPAGPFTCTE